MPDLEPETETYDIYLAAYYAVSGCTMVRKRKEGPRVHFVFTNSGGSMQDMREAFYTNRGKVSAYQYSQQVIAFKQLCFDGN